MWKEIRRAAIVLATSLIAATLIALPAAGNSRLPPEDDGSTFTWPGATTVTVDVEPWGGGYVRSTPYLIDCPLACIRPFDAGREVTFTAYPTSGFTFESWTDACEGQSESLHADDLRCRARRGCGVQRPLRAAVASVSTGSDAQRERLRELPRMRREGDRDGVPSEQLDHAVRSHQQPATRQCRAPRFRDDRRCRVVVVRGNRPL